MAEKNVIGMKTELGQDALSIFLSHYRERKNCPKDYQ
jgi:hypothetical protein